MPLQYFKCDSCGGTFAEAEFVETIEEMLCERCASGIDEDDADDEWDERGGDDYDYYDEPEEGQ